MGIQTPMAQSRSIEFISMIRWIMTSRLSIKKSLFVAAHASRVGLSFTPKLMDLTHENRPVNLRIVRQAQ